jgi:hypothetical protein
MDKNKNKLVKCYTWSITLFGGESWTLRTVDKKYLKSFEMWYWRRMEKISWTDHVRNVEVLQRRIKEERNILQIKNRDGGLTGLVTSCIGTAFLNTLLKERLVGRIEVTVRRVRRCKKLLG